MRALASAVIKTITAYILFAYYDVENYAVLQFVIVEKPMCDFCMYDDLNAMKT